MIDPIPLSLDNSTHGFDGYFGDLLGEALDTRIVNGSTATVNQFPWFVAVRSYTSRGLKSICGGSLISRTWVIFVDTTAIAIYKAFVWNLLRFSRLLTAPMATQHSIWVWARVHWTSHLFRWHRNVWSNIFVTIQTIWIMIYRWSDYHVPWSLHRLCKPYVCHRYDKRWPAVLQRRKHECAVSAERLMVS